MWDGLAPQPDSLTTQSKVPAENLPMSPQGGRGKGRISGIPGLQCQPQLLQIPPLEFHSFD